MNCSEVQQLIPDLLLGEISADDEAVVRTHLSAGCEACAKVTAETEATFGLLFDVVPPDTPSPELADRLLARIETEPVAGSSINNLLREHDWVITAVATVAAALLAMVGSWAVFSSTHSNEAAELRRLQIAVAERKDQIGALRRELQDVGGFSEAMRSSDLYVLNFKATDEVSADASARALWDASGRRLCIAFRGLPKPTDGKVLTIWGDTSDPHRLADFKVTAQGDAALVVHVTDIEPKGFVVSLEAPEAPAPQQPLLVAQVSEAIRLALVETAEMLASR